MPGRGDKVPSRGAEETRFLQSGPGKSCPTMWGLGQMVPEQHGQLLKRFAMLNIAQGALHTDRDLQVTTPY